MLKIKTSDAKSRPYALLCALLAVTVLSFFAAPRVAYAQASPYNYCEQGGRKTAVFLIDASDPYSEVDRNTLLRGFRDLLPKLEGGERLIIKDIGMYRDSSRTLFDDCYPTCPFNLGLGEVCRRQLVTADREKFSRSILNALKDSVFSEKARELPGSSIVGSIAQTIKQYPSPNLLIVYSDFMEYSGQNKGRQNVNFYKDTERQINDFLKSVISDRQVPDLSGTQFIGFGFGKRLGESEPIPSKQNQLVASFWNRYLETSGTQSPILTREFPQN